MRRKGDTSAKRLERLRRLSRLMAEGKYTNAELAAMLGVSVNTIPFYKRFVAKSVDETLGPGAARAITNDYMSTIRGIIDDLKASLRNVAPGTSEHRKILEAIAHVYGKFMAELREIGVLAKIPDRHESTQMQVKFSPEAMLELYKRAQRELEEFRSRPRPGGEIEEIKPHK